MTAGEGGGHKAPAAGDLVWREVSRRGKRGRPSVYSKVHLCRVDHRYGPGGTTEWVVPLCGAAPGRGVTAGFLEDERCRRCAARPEATEKRP